MLLVFIIILNLQRLIKSESLWIGEECADCDLSIDLVDIQIITVLIALIWVVKWESLESQVETD